MIDMSTTTGEVISSSWRTADDIRPGMVVRFFDDGEAVYLYAIHKHENRVYGPLIRYASGDSWRVAGMELRTLPDGETFTYPLNTVPGWPDLVAEYFRDTPDTPTAEPAESAADAYERGRQEATVAAEQRFEAWKENATETAHRYADNNSLCGEFDRCMEEIGLRPREREYNVEVTLTYTTWVTVTAAGSDAADELVNDDPWSFVDLEGLRYDRDRIEVETGEVERA